MLSRLKKFHAFMDKRYGYMIIAILILIFLMARYDVCNWGLPLTDDMGYPLYHK